MPGPGREWVAAEIGEGDPAHLQLCEQVLAHWLLHRVLAPLPRARSCSQCQTVLRRLLVAVLMIR